MKHVLLSIFISVVVSSIANADPGQEAIRKASEAAIKQLGIDKMAKRLEKKYIPEDVRFYGGYTIQLADIAINKRVSYKWEF